MCTAVIAKYGVMFRLQAWKEKCVNHLYPHHLAAAGDIEHLKYAIFT